MAPDLVRADSDLDFRRIGYQVGRGLVSPSPEHSRDFARNSSRGKSGKKQCSKGIACGGSCVNRRYDCVGVLAGNASRQVSKVTKEGGIKKLKQASQKAKEKAKQAANKANQNIKKAVPKVKKAANKTKQALKEEAKNQFDDTEVFFVNSIASTFGTPFSGPTSATIVNAAKEIRSKLKKAPGGAKGLSDSISAEVKGVAKLARENPAQVAQMALKAARGPAIKTVQKIAVSAAFKSVGVDSEAVGAISEITAEVAKAAKANIAKKASGDADDMDGEDRENLGPMRRTAALAQGAKNLANDLGVGMVTGFNKPAVKKAMAGNLGQQLFQFGVGFGLHSALGVGATIGLGALPVFGSVGLVGFGAAMGSAAAGNLARKYAIDPAIERISRARQRRREKGEYYISSLEEHEIADYSADYGFNSFAMV